MSKSLVTLLLLCIVCSSNAQYPKLIVRLKDKGNSTFTIGNPAPYLSQRAILRRTRFNIAIDSTDLPVNAAYLDSISKAGNVKILSTSKWLNQVLIQTTDAAAINKINSFPFVKSTKGIGYRPVNTTPTSRYKETVTPLPVNQGRPAGTEDNRYDYGNSYSQVHIHEGEYLHNKGFQGQSIQITVLDAGFFQYKTITAFDSLRANKQVLGERDFVAFDNSVNEDDSHGMYCLSTMAANWPGRMVGTAPKANYWLVRTEYAPTEYPIEEHNWVVGAEFADSTGSDLISSSLGYNTFDDPAFDHTYAEIYKNSATVTQGATLAAKKGIIVMNSAGNEGGGAWKYIVFPADADSVCAVGAITSSGAIAGFSSIGYPGKIKPNIVSVGVSTVIAGTNNQPSSGNGTSFANPNVAGLVACLWQAFPNLNNMQILNAVYRSADRFTTPDASYGFGIPNFRKAYQSLKHDQNVALYGNEKLFATPNPFTTQVDVKFIGRVDGAATVSLLNSAGQVVATNDFVTETEEVYAYSFTNLSSLPNGSYTAKYSDNTATQSINLQKGNIFEKDWLVVAPNPFRNQLAVYLKAPNAGEISIRLLDIKGSVIETYTTTVTSGETRNYTFKAAAKLAKGVYFVQYIDKNQRRITKVMKG